MDGIMEDVTRFSYPTSRKRLRRITPSNIVDERFKFIFEDDGVSLIDMQPPYCNKEDATTTTSIKFSNEGFKEFLCFIQINRESIVPEKHIMCDTSQVNCDGIMLHLWREDDSNHLWIDGFRTVIGIPIKSLCKINVSSLCSLIKC